jgi:hypothetical protein
MGAWMPLLGFGGRTPDSAALNEAWAFACSLAVTFGLLCIHCDWGQACLIRQHKKMRRWRRRRAVCRAEQMDCSTHGHPSFASLAASLQANLDRPLVPCCAQLPEEFLSASWSRCCPRCCQPLFKQTRLPSALRPSLDSSSSFRQSGSAQQCGQQPGACPATRVERPARQPRLLPPQEPAGSCARCSWMTTSSGGARRQVSGAEDAPAASCRRLPPAAAAATCPVPLLRRRLNSAPAALQSA